MPKPPFTCIYCGAPSWIHPNDQERPPAYCHEEDHGFPEYYDAEEEVE